MFLRLVVSRKIYLQAAHSVTVLASCSVPPGKAQRSSGPNNALIRTKNLTWLIPLREAWASKCRKMGRKKKKVSRPLGLVDEWVLPLLLPSKSQASNSGQPRTTCLPLSCSLKVPESLCQLLFWRGRKIRGGRWLECPEFFVLNILLAIFSSLNRIEQCYLTFTKKRYSVKSGY